MDAQNNWVYIKSEPGLYTVGFYDPKGEWHPDSDFNDREQAASRCHFLNGGAASAVKPLTHQSNAQYAGLRSNQTAKGYCVIRVDLPAAASPSTCIPSSFHQ